MGDRVVTSAIRHVLFDADGVLQILPGGWYAAMRPYLGDRLQEFLDRTWQDELPTLVARRIGADPSTVLFIDDNAENVEGARTAGLEATVWSIEQGHGALVTVLAEHGVSCD